MSAFPGPPPPAAPALGADASSAQFVAPYGSASRPARPPLPPSPATPLPPGASPGGPSHAPTAAAAGAELNKHQQAAGVLARPAEDDRTRLINNVAFPGPYASPSAPGPPPKRDAHLAAAELGAAAYRADGRLASLGQQPPAPYHPEQAWSAAGDKERESQDKKDKDGRAEREKVKRTQIEVLNRPPPHVSSQQPPPPPQQQQQQQQLGGHLPSVDVKTEPQAQAGHALMHPPQAPAPTSSMRGGPAGSSSGRKSNKASGASVTPGSSFGQQGSLPVGGRLEPGLPSLAAGPHPQVRTPFLPTTLGRHAPFLGRFVYGGAQWMLPSDISRKGTELAEPAGPGLANGPGGTVEVVIPAGYLGSGWTLRAAHQRPDAAPTDGWRRLLAGLNLERRLWGTEVYTDDSDLVGMLVHGGWLVPALNAAPAEEAAAAAAEEDAGKRKRSTEPKEAGLRVELRVVGRLLRFIGTDRHGLRSRGWGNSHDGASLIVENVSRIEAARPPTLSRRTKRPRIGQILQMRNELVDEASHETLSLNVFGGAGYKYSPAALIEAMELSELEPPDEDVEAAAAAAEGDGAAGPTYTKLRPDLHDSDLVLENSEEKYRIRLDSPTTSLLSIRIFPKSDPPTVLESAAGSAVEEGAADDDDAEAQGEPLGGGLLRPRDLEWVEGGLIVRESSSSSSRANEAGLLLLHQEQEQQQQQQQQPLVLGEQRGWFVACERWQWQPRPAARQAAAAAAAAAEAFASGGSGGGGSSAKKGGPAGRGGASTIPAWVAAASGADKTAAAAAGPGAAEEEEELEGSAQARRRRREEEEEASAGPTEPAATAAAAAAAAAADEDVSMA